MTQLLQEAIEQLRTLPEDRQEMLAERLLARIEHERRMEAELLADIDEGIAAAERGDMRDGETVMAELRERIKARL